MTSRALRHAIGFLHRLAYATLCGLATWTILATEASRVINGRPAPGAPQILIPIAMVLDYPIALVSRLRIPYFAGIDLFFGDGVGEFMPSGEVLSWHLRVAIPTYILLFYVPNVCEALGRGVRARWKRQREP